MSTICTRKICKIRTGLDAYLGDQGQHYQREFGKGEILPQCLNADIQPETYIEKTESNREDPSADILIRFR